MIGGDLAKNAGALANALQVCATPGVLFTVTGFNTGPDQYIQVFNSAAAVANGQVPLVQIKVPTDSHFQISFISGRKFNAGIYVCNSTGSGSKTIGAADCLLDATFDPKPD